METCKICGKSIGNMGCLKLHLKSHYITFEEYCKKYKIEIPKNNCKICGKIINKGRVYCSKKCQFQDIEYLEKHKKIDRSRSEEYKNTDKAMKCNICDKIILDEHNCSGALTTHLKKIHNIYDIEFNKYFTIIKQVKKEKLICPICSWETVDLENKSGMVTSHVKSHGYDLLEFIELYPEFGKKFRNIMINKQVERKKKLLDAQNFIKCEICGQKLYSISNSHLKLHNITQSEYKKNYGNNLISKSTKKILSENYQLHLAKKQKIFISKAEQEILDYIKSLGIINIKHSDRTIIPPLELNIYLPEYNIAIEYNGLYYHSEISGTKDKNYHINKYKKCNDLGIRLIQIFEDEWINLKDIVKNRIKNILNKTEDKIYARKTIIKEISSVEKNNFLNSYHLQQSDKSNIFLGAFFRDELIAVMTFGAQRAALGSKNVLNSYELYRYATKNKNFIGGASKILSYFIKKYHPEKIITYADLRWSTGNLYEKIGFTKIRETGPNYWYMDGYHRRLHRYNFTKNRIVNKLGGDKNKSEFDNMIELGFDRIWDCGSIKYEMVINN